ncbi:MAG: electron transport complex subunit RsxC [Clostridiales bacterium]|nr:electron transport complex subunit RsxC [Clostridiales bacterium]
MKNTFRGGVHPEGHKDLSRESRLRLFDPKGEMVFPLSMHIGKPAKPVVKKNDEVKVGQLLAEADGFISAPIHSSCSGTVKAIEKRRVLGGGMAECIVINNDGQFTPFADYTQRADAAQLSNQDIIQRVKDAGIVGLGGAGFPTAVKLTPKNADAIEYVIANGAECEPYLTCNDQLMRIHSNEIVEGLELVLRLFPNADGVICIEDNKPEAIEAMSRAASDKPRITVRTMVTKYPQGGERSLIQAVAGVDFPTSKLPADVGCVVQNVGTLYAIQKAVLYGEPLYSQCFTITGEAVAEPGNYMVRVGTSYAELLEAAGGVKEGLEIKKALSGGPMMGVAVTDLSIPIQKQNNGLTLLAEDPVEQAEAIMTSCLRCGRCTTVCPMGLTPQLMADAAIAGDYERYEKKLYGMDCIQCGSCSFACPAKRPLTPTFKQAKAEILERRKREGGAQK